MEVSPTGYVVLGILNWQPRTGYEIKQLVDKSTRFFWAASYGQIYPELKRLESQGLVAGKADLQSARNRKVYRLTAKGRREFDGWMRQPPKTFEMRDEGLLKLFLATGDSDEEIARHLGEMGGHADDVAARLRTIREQLGAAEGSEQLCLRFGIEMNEWIAEWCEREKHALALGASKGRAA
jgi:PadR family transcriptional regulator AphA